MNKKILILMIPALMIPTLFGIFFMGLLVHEGVHVIQSKAPESICYDMQQNTFMSVSHNITKFTEDKSSGVRTQEFKPDDYTGFKIYTEKWATIIGLLFMTLSGGMIGYVIGEQKK